MAELSIRVPPALAARIRERAQSAREDEAAYLARLVDADERSARMEAVRRAYRDNPPDESYWAEVAQYAALDTELPD